MIQFLKSNPRGKNGSPANTRNSNSLSKVMNYENKLIECFLSNSCLTSKILSEIEKLQNNQENCGSEPVLTTYASVA